MHSHPPGSSSRTPRVSRRMAAGCAALLTSLLIAGALTVAPVAVALPEGRTYEMVTPPYKGGYGARLIQAVAPNGESVAFQSAGAFAGAPADGLTAIIGYLAHREASGWSTTPLMPPPALLVSTGQDVSSSLDSTLTYGQLGPNRGTAFELGNELEFMVHPTDTPDIATDWEAATPIEAPNEKPIPVSYEGGSADLCRLFFDGAESPLLPEATEAAEGDQLGLVYELDRGCGGEPQSLHIVGLNNTGRLIDPGCQLNLGVGFYDGSTGPGGSSVESTFNAIADGGEEVFFTSCVGASAGHSSHQLFVRLGGSRTLEVSKPAGEECGEVPCASALSRASADFVGASRDGSRVYFETTAQLVGGDEDNENDLYMATIGCPSGEGECELAKREVTSLVQVSHDSSVGQAAEVQGVVRVAPDGSHVYFIAHGVLGEGPNAQGQSPVNGADNLYVYENDERYPAGHTAFVADICSGPALSGSAQDAQCPSNLSTHYAEDDHLNDLGLLAHRSGGPGGEAQTAGADSRFLVFSSYGQLVANDTDTAKDVYRYDAQTGALERVSLGEEGYDANGNDNAFDATITPGQDGGDVREQYEMNNRAVSEDGSRIVFTSTEPLSPDAKNHLANVYEWHKEPDWSVGRVSLVSTGSAEEPIEDVVISPEGRDIFFVTSQGIAPQDTDGEQDVYDARLQGGFPSASTAQEECSGDACQGPLTNPAPLLVPGSVSQAPGENFPAPKPAVVVKAKKKAKTRVRKKRKKRKREAKRATRVSHGSETASHGRARR